MNSWFDIMSLTPPVIGQPSLEDEKGMLASVRTLSELVRAEVEAGIPSERIVVGGFSQGTVPLVPLCVNELSHIPYVFEFKCIQEPSFRC